MPSPRQTLATSIAVGVLPAPPSTKLPMQMIGTPTETPGSAIRRAEARP